MIELSERDQKVLEAVVVSYIQYGEPVGSRTISKHHGLNVSPATIRNIMSDLEDLELLQQPHTSAGRIPTEKGFRLYLDFIMRFKEIEQAKRDLIHQAYKDTSRNAKSLLRQTSHILSRFCRQAGVVLWPKLSLTRFKHIEFIRLRPDQILVILISASGLVHQSVLEWEEDIRQDDLDKYSRYLNELFENVPLGEVKQRILAEMENEKVLFDELYKRALEISQRVFQSNLEKADIYIEGQTNLLNSPEFADVERMRRLLETFEDKSRIIRLLDMALKPSSRVRIILGPESELRDLQEISLISSPYKRGDTVLGVLGVIGPIRMDYSRIIPVVEFTAGLLSRMLEDPESS